MRPKSNYLMPKTLREDKDTISYTMTFPNLQVNDGDPYTVCTVSVEDFNLNCIDGNNAP